MTGTEKQLAGHRWKQRPPGSNWGDFGADDQAGRMNLLTPAKVLQGVREVHEGIHPCEVRLVEGDWLLSGASGYSLVVTGTANTMLDARKEAYSRVKSILIPNMMYRTDIGERWARDGDLLQSWGLLS